MEFVYVDLLEIMIKVENEENFFILIFDGLIDFYNLGFILCIVDVINVIGIIIFKYCFVGVILVVLKIFIGVVEYVFIVRVINFS